jgi:hypothetical protein
LTEVNSVAWSQQAFPEQRIHLNHFIAGVEYRETLRYFPNSEHAYITANKERENDA